MSAPAALRPALAGAAALCTTIGLARFGYVPLFPALVSAGWVGGGEAGALGATTFAGHLLGALVAPGAARRMGMRRVLDLAMALATLSFLACALQLGFGWLALWRGLAGVAGGLAISLAGPAVQAVTPEGRRGRAAGVVTAGVGAGVALAALLVPSLLGGGLVLTWLGLGLAAALLWGFAHPRWPDPVVPAMAAGAGGAAPRGFIGPLLLIYGLSAAGMTAPMVYLADLAVRGHGMGFPAAGLVWGLFGLGAVCGTLLGGRVTDRLGRWAVPLWMVAQVAALGLALLTHPAAAVPAAFFSGFSGVGVTAVALARLRTVVGAATGRYWARATAVYAVAQALTGYGFAWLFAASGEQHAPVFLAGLLLSLAGLAAALRRG
ncbi:MFS transporter [Roseomonas xinghualingensis]|uniref:MFS transporter n=1 Tax=Roseomonas xinghualingensis TaxID=2986475 RepID=UPI0021F0BA2D|nr:MFS transporter [Roseomonas sp. SXEYE001]MCV4206432.1 MFS transporter [Roseomonas sp. SXEYE001]